VHRHSLELSGSASSFDISKRNDKLRHSIQKRRLLLAIVAEGNSGVTRLDTLESLIEMNMITPEETPLQWFLGNRKENRFSLQGFRRPVRFARRGR